MANRQAEALARLLEDRSPAVGEGPAELRVLGAFADALQAATPRPDDAFKSELRAMLVEEARVMQAAAAPRILPRVRAQAATAMERWRYSTRVAAASLSAALAFSGGGAVAVAAERALPSDAFYGVKLALDEARAGVRFDVVAKGETHLANASQRVDEAEQSTALGDQDGAALALHESTESARKGAKALIDGYAERGDQAIVQTLEDFAESQGRRVRVLAARLDGDAARAARGSLIVLERIEARLVAIGGCAECTGTETPPDGEAFDMSDIPPADQPFQPCPCDDENPSGTSRPRRGGTATPPDGEPAGPADDGDQPPPDDADDPDVVPGLPEPVGGAVNELLKGIVTKSAEKSPAGMPADLRAPALADAPAPALLP
jgi:hypothetical protein